MNLVTEYLNPDALSECRNRIMQMSIWMQGILVGIVFLLAGCALLELLCGLQMQKYARFVTGFAVGTAVCFVILQGYTDIDDVKLLLYALAAGAVSGLLNAFLERVFQFAAGFLFGTALATWLVPEILKKELTKDPGRILRLVIAIAAGVLFALLAKKLRFLLAALLGGTILGLLIESFVSYAQIPYLPEMHELSEGMYRNILPLALAGIGILIQLPQLISRIRTERELRIPPGNAEDNYFTMQDGGSGGAGQSAESGEEKTEETPTQAELNIAEAEAVLVEKARELALAASRSAEDIRLRERYEDVEQGLYSSEAAAERLGISEETFLEGMRQGGFRIPGEEIPEERAEESTEEPSEEDTGESTEAVPAEENAEESTGEIPKEKAEESTGEIPEENAEVSTEKSPEEEPESRTEENPAGEPGTEETENTEDTEETDGPT